MKRGTKTRGEKGKMMEDKKKRKQGGQKEVEGRETKRTSSWLSKAMSHKNEYYTNGQLASVSAQPLHIKGL